MVTIKALSDKPCFLCGSKEDTADVKFRDGSFQGVVCKTHLFQLLKRQAKEAADAPAQAGR